MKIDFSGLSGPLNHLALELVWIFLITIGSMIIFGLILQPSQPLFTKRMNCLLEVGESSLLNSLISSFEVNLSSPTLTKIFSVEIFNSFRISSNAGLSSFSEFRKPPNTELIHKEMAKSGVTLSLL